ncbi:MAG: ATP-dependent DNA ligase, partial [Candidatus Thorarchaeota archaeon]
MTEFQHLADVLDEVSGTSKRTEKVDIAAKFLRDIPIADVGYASLFLGGKVFGESDLRTLNISWRGLLNALKNMLDIDDKTISEVYDGDIGEAVATVMEHKGEFRQSSLFSESLTISSVARTLSRIADVQGKGSTKEKQSLLTSLFMDASPREARYLTALVLEDTRTGLSEGLLAEVIASAYRINPALVRRAWSFIGDLGEVATIASKGGSDALNTVTIKVMRGVKPMLASPVSEMDTLFEDQTKQYSLEMKLDGARVQIHKNERDVRIFSRKLSDMTEGLPEIVEVVKSKINADVAILDGEVLAVDEKGKPFPFQVVMKRFGRTRDIEEAFKDTRLLLVLFDLLLLGNKQLVDEPYSQRRKRLEEIAPPDLLVERLVSTELAAAKSFFEKSQKLG